MSGRRRSGTRGVPALGLNREHGRQEPGKQQVDLVSAELVPVRRALGAGPNEAGIAQHTKVVRHAGLRSSAIQGGTRGLAAQRQLAHDAQPDGIAQRVQHLAQRDVFDGRMVDRPHAPSLA